LSNLLTIFVSILMGAIGQILLKVGADKLGNFTLSLNTIYSDLLNLIKNPEIIIGLFLFGSSFLLWVKVLTKSQLSYAYPMVSLSYVIIVVASTFLFKETITMNKTLGTAIIILGVYLINR